MDQASKLRSAIIKKNGYSYSEDTIKEETGPRVICIASGKGGVGKSNFTINLALALKNSGNRVVVIDADLGLANIEILLGITPKVGLIDLIREDISIEDVMIEGPRDIKIISGGAGIAEIVDLPFEKLNKILNSIVSLNNHADFVLIDSGAGISRDVMSFISASEEIIVVTTPEPTAIADAYALIKIATKDDFNKVLNLIVNKAEDKQEGEVTFNKLNLASKKFLNKEIEYLGHITNDRNVPVCVKKQIPFYIGAPNSMAAEDINSVCNKLLGKKETNKIFNTFVKRLSNFFFNNRG